MNRRSNRTVRTALAKILPLLLGVGLTAALSCSDDNQPPPSADARTDSHAGDLSGKDSGTVDRLVASEKKTSDLPGADSSGSTCNSSLDLTPLSLDSSYCVVARYPMPTSSTTASTLDGFTFSASTFYFYRHTSGTPFTGTVEESAGNPKTNTLATPATVFSFTPTTTGTGTLYASAFLARSSTGILAAGYTDSSQGGEIYYGQKGGTPKSLSQAKGNYDAIYIDGSTLLVNGLGLGAAQDGQGIYLVESGKTPRRLIKDLGSYSGSLAASASILYAGGYFSTGNKIYGFTLQEVKSAISSGATLSATTDGDLCFAGSALDVTAVGDDLIVVEADSSYKFSSVSATTVTSSGSSVTPASNKKSIVTPGTSTASVSLVEGSDKPLALLFSSTKTELAVVQKK